MTTPEQLLQPAEPPDHPAAAHENPTRNGIAEQTLNALIVAGGVVAISAAVTVPVLGLAGFGAVGPIAGSAAATWQASMGGPVAAGSLFAWCQSAAMGGAAAETIAGVGVGGGVAAGGSTATKLFRWARWRQGKSDEEAEVVEGAKDGEQGNYSEEDEGGDGGDGGDGGGSGDDGDA